jgi:hypothetical protein
MNRSRFARAALLLCSALFCPALFCLALPDGSVASDRPELLDGSSDRILRRAFIPSDRNVHGEVRLIRRGEAWVLQTLIQSPQLRRGVQRMRKQELYSWPASEPGHEDSTRYLEDLEAAKDHAIAELEQRDDRSQRAQQMLIELILGPDAALWAFYEVATGHEGSEPVIGDKEPISVRPASRTYLHRAFRLQAEAGFDGAVPELTELPL